MIGVLDWELSTLGHPLSDLGNIMQPFSVDCSNPAGVNDAEEVERAAKRGDLFIGLGNLSPEQCPVPTKETNLKTYCQAAGREYPIPNWAFCEAWAWFRVSKRCRLTYS